MQEPLANPVLALCLAVRIRLPVGVAPGPDIRPRVQDPSAHGAFQVSSLGGQGCQFEENMFALIPVQIIAVLQQDGILFLTNCLFYSTSISNICFFY
jgi:hypothetical protein